MSIVRRTILGIDLKTDEKITVNDKERCSGTYILGVQGRGKSSLLLTLIAQDMEKGYAVIVFDAHDDLIRHLIALMPSERLDKTYLLDLDDTEFPYGLNLFACSDPSSELERAIVVERVLHVFERLWPDIRGILLEKMLRYITLTFLECPGYSLIDIRRLLWDDDFRAALVSQLTNQDVKSYWLYEYNMMTRGERRAETQALDNRLASFLSTPFIRNIVCQR
jgi:DNA helicase HerA-like ATPase